MGKYFHVDGKRLEEQYVSCLSNFLDWKQLDHASEWVLFEDNISEYLSIDETCLSQGELYTVVTNKLAHCKKGALVAMIKGTESEYVSTIPCFVQCMTQF